MIQAIENNAQSESNEDKGKKDAHVDKATIL